MQLGNATDVLSLHQVNARGDTCLPFHIVAQCTIVCLPAVLRRCKPEDFSVAPRHKYQCNYRWWLHVGTFVFIGTASDLGGNRALCDSGQDAHWVDHRHGKTQSLATRENPQNVSRQASLRGPVFYDLDLMILNHDNKILLYERSMCL